MTYDGNKVTFTATGVGTYSLISELVEGAEERGYIHTTTQTMPLTIQPGPAQATLALDKDSYLSGDTVTVTVTPGTPVAGDQVTGFTLSMSNGETTVSSEKYETIPETVSLTLPDDAQGTWTVSAEVTLANAQGQDVTGFYDAVSTVSLLAGDPLVTISLHNGPAFAPSDFVSFWLSAKKRPDGGRRRHGERVSDHDLAVRESDSKRRLRDYCRKWKARTPPSAR